MVERSRASNHQGKDGPRGPGFESRRRLSRFRSRSFLDQTFREASATTHCNDPYRTNLQEASAYAMTQIDGWKSSLWKGRDGWMEMEMTEKRIQEKIRSHSQAKNNK